MTLIRRPGAAAVTFLFLLMGAAFLTQVVPYRQIIETQRQVATARSELETLETHNAELQADVSALETDAEIPPGTKDHEPADPAPAPVDKTWVERVWEFITGADLSS
jgi:hypothetical protein